MTAVCPVGRRSTGIKERSQHAIKLKTSAPSFCFSLQLKQNAKEGCNSCASLAGLVLCFIACFVLLVIAPLHTLMLQEARTNYHHFRDLIWNLVYKKQLNELEKAR